MSVPSQNGGASAAAATNSGTPQYIKDSYIVKLRPNLGRVAYEKHLEEIYHACRGVKTTDNKDACIESVYSEPIDATEPTSVTYFALFPETLAAIVGRRSDVQNIHLEHLGQLDIIGTHQSPTVSWGPASMSQPVQTFHGQYKAFKLNGAQQPGPFLFNALPLKGPGSTVYVIDSGYKANPAVDQEFVGRHDFIDVEKYRSELRLLKQAGPSPWIPWNWCKSWKQERITATEHHDEVDNNLKRHGTNVSLCVGSRRRGVASEARVVTIRGTWATDDRALREKNVYDALQIISDQNPGRKSVITCSWRIPFTGNDTGRADMMELTDKFHSLRNKGVTVVASAGNHGVKLVRGVQDGCLNVELSLPRCLEYAYLVASCKYDGTRSDFSNYITTDTTGKLRPKNKIIWAPGEDLPMYQLVPNATNTITESGTSFATPFVAGVIAWLLVDLQEGEKLEDKLATVLRKGPIKDWRSGFPLVGY